MAPRRSAPQVMARGVNMATTFIVLQRKESPQIQRKVTTAAVQSVGKRMSGFAAPLVMPPGPRCWEDWQLQALQSQHDELIAGDQADQMEQDHDSSAADGL